MRYLRFGTSHTQASIRSSQPKKKQYFSKFMWLIVSFILYLFFSFFYLKKFTDYWLYLCFVDNLKKKNDSISSHRKLARQRSNISSKRSSKVVPSASDSKTDDHSSMSEFHSHSAKTDNFSSSKTDLLSSKYLTGSKKNLIACESISEYNSAV